MINKLSMKDFLRLYGICRRHFLVQFTYLPATNGRVNIVYDRKMLCLQCAHTTYSAVQFSLRINGTTKRSQDELRFVKAAAKIVEIEANCRVVSQVLLHPNMIFSSKYTTCKNVI